MSLFLAPCPCLCSCSSQPQFTFSISLSAYFTTSSFLLPSIVCVCVCVRFHPTVALRAVSHPTSLLGEGIGWGPHLNLFLNCFSSLCPHLNLFLPVCVPISAQWQQTEANSGHQSRKRLSEGHRPRQKTQITGRASRALPNPPPSICCSPTPSGAGLWLRDHAGSLGSVVAGQRPRAYLFPNLP